MPANNSFTDEEKKLFSEILALRNSDHAHFRRAFKELQEEQVRFLEYKEMMDLKVENRTELRGEPVLNGFRLSQAAKPPSSDITVKNNRRCNIL